MDLPRSRKRQKERNNKRVHGLQMGATVRAVPDPYGIGARIGSRISFGQNADSDDLARVYRFDLAQDSEMISPTILI